jgi:uncharacterized integral membrane protein
MVSIHHQDDDGQSTHESHAGDLAKLLPALIVAAALTVFAFANTQTTTVDLVFTTKRAPLIVVLAITAVAGAVVVALLRFRRRHHS